MLDRALSAPALLWIAAALLLPVSTTQAAEPPYEAVIIAGQVAVRSGAGRAYYEVGDLGEGDTVTVEDELFGWYKIKCPPGVFSFVDRKNVDAKGDGSRGVVNTDRTPVNAAHATKGPADSYRKLLDLDAGDTVEIIETVGNAYKIRPPKNAYVFLPPNSLAPADTIAKPAPVEPAPPAEPKPAPEPVEPIKPIVIAPEPALPQEPAPVAPPQPVNPRQRVDNPPTVVKPEPTVVEPAPVKPKPMPEPPSVAERVKYSPQELLNDPDVVVPAPDTEVTSNAQNMKVRAVEVAILPYFSLPVDEQPIAKMVQGYADAALIEDLSDHDLAIIRARLAELERNRELASALAQVDTVEPTPVAPAPVKPTDSTAEAPETPPMPEPVEPGDATAEAPEPAETPEVPVPTPTPPAAVTPAIDYDAVGILSASTVHTGTNQPELLRLLDPTGRRTVAYLEPGGKVDTVQMLGRLVGITGQTVYDPTTKLNLIQIDSIDILSPNN